MNTLTVAPPRPLPTVRTHPGRTGRRAFVIAAAALGGLWATLCFAPDLQRVPFAAACVVLVSAEFSAAAVVVARQPERQQVGLLLGLAGLFWPVNTMGGWLVGPVPVLRGLVEGLFWMTVAAAVFLYQHPRLALPERTFLGVGVAHFVGTQILWVLVSRPEWDGFPADSWWPSPMADRWSFDVVGTMAAGMDVALAMAFVIILLRRGRRVAALDRHSLAPVVVAIVVAALASVLAWVAYERTTVLIAMVLIPLPLAFLYGALRLSSLRVRLGEALELAPDGPEGIVAALRSTLRDPSLIVRFWSPESGSWVDEAARSCDRPELVADRWRVPVVGRDSRTTAEVETVVPSAAVRRSVESAVRLSGVAIENARLQALVRVQLEASRRAHARTVEAAIAERRRLERDLHDGAQQQLHGLALTLARVRRAAHVDVDVDDLLDQARGEIGAALEELRDLAHGLRPGTLLREGLGPALGEVAERTGLPVELDVRTGGDRADVDAALYFVVCEALTNVVKHGRADRAWVRVDDEMSGIVLDVRDDGVGGADPEGSGIRGMADRIVGLGGSFAVRSDRGRGTWIRAHVPRP